MKNKKKLLDLARQAEEHGLPFPTDILLEMGREEAQEAKCRE
jgi:hypothetical protein